LSKSSLILKRKKVENNFWRKKMKNIKMITLLALGIFTVSNIFATNIKETATFKETLALNTNSVNQMWKEGKQIDYSNIAEKKYIGICDFYDSKYTVTFDNIWKKKEPTLYEKDGEYFLFYPPDFNYYESTNRYESIKPIKKKNLKIDDMEKYYNKIATFTYREYSTKGKGGSIMTPVNLHMFYTIYVPDIKKALITGGHLNQFDVDFRIYKTKGTYIKKKGVTLLLIQFRRGAQSYSRKFTHIYIIDGLKNKITKNTFKPYL
jgi:hypothetical protein